MSIDLARRRLFVSFGSSALVGLAGAQPPERVVRLVAKRFVFLPETIELTLAQPVRLQLSTLDLMMGFSCAELGLRADIVPDRITTLLFTPRSAGRFQFNCDVFCGSGHEEMSGTIDVA